jgi:hypothetical protein
MSDHELDIENLPNRVSIGSSDELVVVDKSITTGPDATANGKTSKILFSDLGNQILPSSPNKGTKGSTGIKGEMGGGGGSTGSKGYVGETGLPGISGTRGYRGFSGEKGENGEPSQTGLLGQPGSIGPRGDVGLDGSPGQLGEKGNTSLSGPRGYRGDIGDTGILGYQGSKGNKGSVGMSVVTGYKGQKGPTGYSRKGERGEMGQVGDRGNKGTKGEKGKTGVDDENVEFLASDMIGTAWSQSNISGELMFSDTRSTGYNPNSRLLIKVSKGNYFGKWKTNNDLYCEVCLQNTDFVKGPTITSGYLEFISDGVPYPVMLMPHSIGSAHSLKVCVFDGTTRYDLPYKVFECDEF